MNDLKADALIPDVQPFRRLRHCQLDGSTSIRSVALTTFFPTWFVIVPCKSATV